MSWLSRLANVFRASKLDAELDEELRFHRDSRIDDLMRGSLSREEAEARAARQLGNALRLREESREIKLIPWLESVLKDIRFGSRVLRKDAVVTAAAVASLALAIGACAAAFSLVDALILRPLPVWEPERLFYLTYPTETNARGEALSYKAFTRLSEAAGAQAVLFGFEQYPRGRRAVFHDAPGQEELTQYVSSNSFAVLGVGPAAIGRVLSPSDDAPPGAHPVAVLSHAFWTRRFGRDSSILGRWFDLEGRQFQIVGVAPERFTGIEPGKAPDLWLAVAMQSARILAEPASNWLRVLGRLNDRVRPEQARSALQAAFTPFRRELARQFDSDRPRAQVEGFVNALLEVRSAANGPSALRGEFERPLWILALIVGLVLVVAGSNVANLFLARAAAREHEMSLRLSIGASRGRLVQQVLVESGLVAGAACVLGFLVATIAAPAIVAMLASSATSVYLDLRPDWRLLAFLGALGALTTIAFGLAPALRASGVAPVGALGAAGKRFASRPRLLRPLVAAQVGFSLAVLFVGTLLVVSFAKLARVDVGFEKSGLLLLSVDSRGLEDPAQQRATALRLVEHVGRIPGVQAASMSGWALFSGSGSNRNVRVPGRAVDSFRPYFLAVSPGFFETMRIQPLQGRIFELRDAPGASFESAVVNEAFARRYLEGDAVGRTFETLAGPGRVTQRIIGVVANAKYGGDLRMPPTPTVYIPIGQRGMGPPGRLGTLQVRAPLNLLSTLRREVRSVHPSLSVSDAQLQATLVDNALVTERLLALLSGFFAAIGLLLAAIGLYAVLSYSVVRRRREIGIRMALGAPELTLIRSVVSDAAMTVAFGAVAGLAVGLYLSRFVKTLLYEVEPLGVWSVALPLGCLIAAALVATLPPARRAARVDPIVALRYE